MGLPYTLLNIYMEVNFIKKTIIFLTLFLTACSVNQKNKNDSSISDMTREKMINDEILVTEDNVDDLAKDNEIKNTNIDCKNIPECIEKDFLIKEKFKDIIKNITYVDVIGEDNQLLGYSANYEFKKYKYQDKEECTEIGKLLKETINNHKIDFYCSNDGFFEVTKSR